MRDRMIDKVKTFFERTEVIWYALVSCLFNLLSISGFLIIIIWKRNFEVTTASTVILWVSFGLMLVSLFIFKILNFSDTAYKELLNLKKKPILKLIMIIEVVGVIIYSILISQMVVYFPQLKDIFILCLIEACVIIFDSFIAYWSGYFDYKKLRKWEKEKFKEELEERVLSRKNKKLKRGKHKC